MEVRPTAFSASIEADLRRAIDRNEFDLQFQPKVAIPSGRPVGAEALLRWNRPGGSVPPEQFIPVAEKCGLILPLTDWVIEAACRHLRSWSENGALVPPVASISRPWC